MPGLRPYLAGVDDAAHDKQEHKQIHGRQHDVLVAPEPLAVLAQPRQQLVGVQQAHRAQDAQEAGRLSGDGREERDDCRYVGPSGRMRKLAQTIAADGEARQKIQEDQHAEDDIEPFECRIAGKKGRDDDEQYSHDVEGEQAIAKAVRRGASDS